MAHEPVPGNPMSFTRLVSSIYKMAPDEPEGWDVIRYSQEAWLWRGPTRPRPGPCRRLPMDMTDDEQAQLLLDYLFR